MLVAVSICPLLELLEQSIGIVLQEDLVKYLWYNVRAESQWRRVIGLQEDLVECLRYNVRAESQWTTAMAFLVIHLFLLLLQLIESQKYIELVHMPFINQSNEKRFHFLVFVATFHV